MAGARPSRPVFLLLPATPVSRAPADLDEYAAGVNLPSQTRDTQRNLDFMETGRSKYGMRHPYAGKGCIILLQLEFNWAACVFTGQAGHPRVSKE